MTDALDLAATLDGGQRSAEVPVSEYAIRTWCAALDETNPLYLDEAAARRAGYPTVLAPPAMLQTWTMPVTDRAAHPTLHARVRGLAREAGLTAVVATDYEQEYLRPIHPGVLLTERSRVEAVSALKDTALGRGRFVTIGFTIADDEGPVGRLRARTFYFDPAPGERGRRPASVNEGPQNLEPLAVPLSRTLIVTASLASNDHEAVHHDHQVATAQGLPDIIASIVTTAGLVLRFTGATSGRAWCRSLQLRLARPAVPGDVLTLRGHTDGRTYSVCGDHARGGHVYAEVGYAAA
ncbi:MaoC family dehydratase N-terminal domain-containing protein [Pseudonocardia sp. KRD291]|uniref:FAS1-like dehydratase domain-containing protein n=1 Tax=Pseudonocardia sp. KRD291 TaxID=2792007 RepID=UPI001C4A041F|nr:MaoC family dehydratase N-terminal domain-containing protein [Pseudonocardia sp. KRD291]MBW0100991.1 MaoC family dehydratase N-terminal domain-containing protein [Pseudonocardia sp. KRD291]